jgi:hypothetical protein
MTTTINEQRTETTAQIHEAIERLRDDALMVGFPEHAETALFFIEYEVREIRRLLASRE